MQLDPRLEAQLVGGRIGIFFRLGLPEVQRLWLGVGRVAVSDAIDTDGAVYRGFGELTDVPAVSQLLNGVADRYDFALTGVRGHAAQLAAIEADTVRGARVNLGLGFFDPDYQFSGLIWLFEGEADYASIALAPGQTGEIWSIKLSVGSAMTGRRRKSQSVFSDPDQQRLHPGDRFCERAQRYSQGVAAEWPRY